MDFLLFVFVIAIFAIFKPVKSGVYLFGVFCFFVLVLVGRLVWGGEEFSWVLLLKFLSLSSLALMVLYRLRWSDFKYSDLFSIRACLGGVPLKGGRTQRVIMDVLFYFFMLTCLALAVVRFLAR